MSTIKIVGIILVVVGVIGFSTGGFSYMGGRDVVKMGPMEMSVAHEHAVNIPLWVGLGAIVVGAGLLLSERRRG